MQGTFIFAYAVLAEAILGFLGVGVPPYVPSWGNVIASGKNVIREAFWVSLFPGLALTVTGLSLNLLGDGLRDTLDPRLRGTLGREPALRQEADKGPSASCGARRAAFGRRSQLDLSPPPAPCSAYPTFRRSS